MSFCISPKGDPGKLPSPHQDTVRQHCEHLGTGDRWLSQYLCVSRAFGLEAPAHAMTFSINTSYLYLLETPRARPQLKRAQETQVLDQT